MEHPVLFHRPIHPVGIQDKRVAIEWIARNVFLRVGLNPYVMVLWFFEFPESFRASWTKSRSPSPSDLILYESINS